VLVLYAILYGYSTGYKACGLSERKHEYWALRY
jgi:hypothetical protein